MRRVVSECLSLTEITVYLDDIAALQDPELCFDVIDHDLRAYIPPSQQGKGNLDLMSKPRWVAEQFASRYGRSTVSADCAASGSGMVMYRIPAAVDMSVALRAETLLTHMTLVAQTCCLRR